MSDFTLAREGFESGVLDVFGGPPRKSNVVAFNMAGLVHAPEPVKSPSPLLGNILAL